MLQILSGLDRVDRTTPRLIYRRGLTQRQVDRELALPGATIRRCVAHGMRELAGHLTARKT